MMDDSSKLMDRVQILAHEAEDKTVKVSNVVNELQMLASNQFIEHRVYDEDHDEPELDVGQEPSEQEGTSMVAQISQSLQNGLQVIDKRFAGVLKDSTNNHSPDSDDDEDTLNQEVHDMLKQNTFSERRLPPIIGSQDFMKRNFMTLLSDATSPVSDRVDAPVVTSVSDNLVVDQSFEAYDHHEEDFDDRQEPADIVFSDSDSDDFFKPQTHTKSSGLPTAVPSAAPLFPQIDKTANLFKDDEEDDMFDSGMIPPKVISTEPPSKEPLSFKNELSRRLASGPTIPGNQPQQETSNRLPAKRASVTSSSEADIPVNPTHVTVQAPVKEPLHVPSKPISKPEKTSAKSGFDFFSDDDDSDDNFDIFAKKQETVKPKTRPVVKAKVSQVLLESSSDEELKIEASAHRSEATGRRISQQDPVAKHRQSLPRDEPSFVASEPPLQRIQHSHSDKNIVSEKSSSSALFADDSVSDDDLFSQKTSRTLSSREEKSQVSNRRASALNVLTSSPEDRQEDTTAADRLSISPPVEVQLKQKQTAEVSDSEESDQEKKMDRKSISSRLENTIFGSVPKKKPVGGISIFKDVNPKPTESKKVPDEQIKSSQEQVSVSKENSAPESNELLLKSRCSSSSSGTSSMTVKKANQSPQLLSSVTLKTRAKIPTARRRPTRSAMKVQPVIPDKSLPEDPQKKSEIDLKPRESNVTDIPEKLPEAKMPENRTVAKVTKASIFSDSEDDEDIFSSKVMQRTVKSDPQKTSLFPDSSDDDDDTKKTVPSVEPKTSSDATLVKKEVKEKAAKIEEPKKKSGSSKKLFDDSDDDEGE